MCLPPVEKLGFTIVGPAQNFTSDAKENSMASESALSGPYGTRHHTETLRTNGIPRKEVAVAHKEGHPVDVQAFEVVPQVEPRLLQGRPLAEVLELMRDGVLVVDQSGAIHYWNRAARDLVECIRGLTIRGGRLASTPASGGERLLRCLRDCIFRRQRGFLGFRAKRPINVALVPLGESAHADPKIRSLAAIILTEPNRSAVPSGQQLRALYALTAAETRLAICICERRPLGEVASSFGVSINTLRSQLRSILAKTDARSQADLIRLCSKLSAFP
jgi:DNA-binding CsgD family transcriptional regulator